MKDYKKYPQALFDDLRLPTNDPILAQALTYLYKESFTSVKAYVLNNSGGLQDAKAVMNLGLQILYDKGQQGKLQNGNLSALFYTICKFRWLDELRKKKGTDLNIDDDESSVHHKLGETVEEERPNFDKRNAIVREELQKMKDPKRSIMMDRYFGGSSVKELAAQYEFSVTYIRQILFRGRNDLRDNLLNRPDFEI